MKPLYDVAKASITWFAIYHPYYKDKLVGNSTRKFVSAANRLYFPYNWRNLLAAFFFAYDSGTCAAKLDIVTKKEESPRTFLRHSQLSSLSTLLLLDSTFSKMRLAMFEYLAMFKCTPMSEWQSENLLEVTLDPFLPPKLPPKQFNPCQTTTPYQTSDYSGKLLINLVGYVTSNSTKILFYYHRLAISSALSMQSSRQILYTSANR